MIFKKIQEIYKILYKEGLDIVIKEGNIYDKRNNMCYCHRQVPTKRIVIYNVVNSKDFFNAIDNKFLRFQLNDDINEICNYIRNTYEAWSKYLIYKKQSEIEKL
jgi:hypothetical protein